VNNKINLLVITREYPIPIASTKRIQHLLEYLNSFDINIRVLSLRCKNTLSQEKGFYNGISYQRIGSEVSFSITNTHKILIFYFRTFFAIIKNKRKGDKNIIYYYGGINIENILFVLLSKLIGFKLIFDIVEDYTGFTDNVKLISKFKFWTIRKFDHLNVLLSGAIVVISSTLQKKYEMFGGRNVTLISITAKPSKYQKIESDGKNTFKIVYAGTFGDKDGLGIIIEGFIEINRIYTNTELILIGSSHQQMDYQKKYQNHSSIKFTGFIPDHDYFQLLKNANVLCMCRKNTPFANAGFPFKLGEYLATGNPVIATKVSDIQRFLSDGNAYLIDPDDIQQFINSLSDIISNPNETIRKC